MSRKIDADNRAEYRWEFVRRNMNFRNDYKQCSTQENDLIDLSAINNEKIEHFINNYFVYPLNPQYSYKQVLGEYKKMVKFLTDHIKDHHRIYEKYLGKDVKKRWAEFITNKNKSDSKKFELAKNKADKEAQEFKRSINYDSIKEKRYYVNKALYQLSRIELSPTQVNNSFPSTTIINSYLAGNPNIKAKRSDLDLVWLEDSTIQKGSSAISNVNGDLSKVCFEIDLTFPTDDIVEDFKKEISKWKMVERKYYKHKRPRQRLSPSYVRELLKAFDLKEKNMIYREIAGSSAPHAVQKTMNMYKKAKEFIDGEYKQIR
jgi:hypothetical protein